MVYVVMVTPLVPVKPSFWSEVNLHFTNCVLGV